MGLIAHIRSICPPGEHSRFKRWPHPWMSSGDGDEFILPFDCHSLRPWVFSQPLYRHLAFHSTHPFLLLSSASKDICLDERMIRVGVPPLGSPAPAALLCSNETKHKHAKTTTRGTALMTSKCRSIWRRPCAVHSSETCICLLCYV